MNAHHAIAINTLSLPTAALDVQMAMVAELGVAAFSPEIAQVETFGVVETARAISNSGLAVATVTHRAFGFATPDHATTARMRLLETIAVAARIGDETITLTTGGRGDLVWSEAAARFVEAMRPCGDAAHEAGVRLSLEPTSHLYADASIAHRLSETLALACDAGIHVGIDIFACWVDADIEAAIAAAGPHTALVQVSDYVLGDRSLPCRCVPGDGAVPLTRMIAAIHASGYRGRYDIEAMGPRLTPEHALADLARGVSVISGMIAVA